MTPNTNEKYNTEISSHLFALDDHLVNLINLYKDNKFPKVLMLSGEKGIGKYTLIFHLINYFLSQNNSQSLYNIENKVINVESSVYKDIVNNTSQNFTYVQNEDKNKATIDQIRELKKKFNKSTLNNQPRFIIFDDVELLNINSANSLLKFIEEPSASNYFILINNKRYPIIETIKSRAIENKIFLTNEQKEKIFLKLMAQKKIEDHYCHKFINFTTPGLLLKYHKIIDEYNINIDNSFYEIAFSLLEKFKKNKNQICLDCLNFILEIKSDQIKKSNTFEFIKIINVKNNIMKLMYNYKKFNLTNNTVLDYIKKNISYYA